MSPLLLTTNVNAYYGAYHALQGVSFEMLPSERVALFGHNGSGKSTLMKCLVGALPDVQGEIRFAETVIEPGNVPKNVKRGLAYVGQSKNVFRNLSVERNLAIARLMRGRDDVEGVWSLFPVLKQRRRQLAGSMSGGEQQMLAFSMALLTDPKLMLLDEPTSGLSPRMAETLLRAMVEISTAHGIAIVVIEHNVPRTLAYVERAIILKSGRIIEDRSAADLKQRAHLWDWF